eukprot:164848_1
MANRNSHHSLSNNKVSDNLQQPKSTSKPKDTHIKSKKPNNIDFSSFESTQQCDEKTPNINNCACITRIIHSLKYYAFLNTKRNKEGQVTFINFIQTLYLHYLNDMIHLTTTHEQDLQDINNMLFDKYGFKKCDVKSCVLTDRHCKMNRRNNNNNENKTEDNTDKIFMFYQDVFDSMHYYLFHLFDLG